MSIIILDCTLRDGGYVNNWEFGEENIRKISSNLISSDIEIVECGFLSQTKSSTKKQSIFSSVAEAEYYLSNNGRTECALMINCGEYNSADIPEYSGGAVNLIRIAFHKHQQEAAQTLCGQLKEKGYKVFFQPMVTMGYTDKELIQLVKWSNLNQVDAFYIVDSFGTMRQSDVKRLYCLIDSALDKNIKIGFHSHNNLQLSFSNAQELINLHSNRDIIIDSTVLGIGRGAGNLCTELLAQYINENIHNKYDLIPILEIMDECIMPIYSQHPWGYSAAYYLAAVNNCHPNYATYLVNKQTISVCDINTIIKNIPLDKKNFYDKSLINELYVKYLQHNVDDTEVIKKIAELCKDREILLLAPGKSLTEKHKQIEEYITSNREHLVIISVNHIPEKLPFDKIFVGNLKRFNNINKSVSELTSKIICTSNVGISGPNVVNYTSYLNNDDIIADNSGLMLINILKKAGAKKFAFAGFDGFKLSSNYYSDKMVFGVEYEKHLALNKAIAMYFNKMKNTCDIKFLTDTIYTDTEL